MNSIQILFMSNNFPFGSIFKDNVELLSKVKIVLYLSEIQEQFSIIENIAEIIVMTFLGKVLALEKNEFFPTLAQAECTLKLSTGFI